MAGPAEVLQKYLNDLGVTVPAESVGANQDVWVSVRGTMPAQSPDNVVVLRDTGAVQQGRDHRTGQRTTFPTVQITVRSEDYDSGLLRGQIVQGVFDKVGVDSPLGVGWPLVDLGPDDDKGKYQLRAVHVMVPVTWIGQEEKNNRNLFTVNVMVTMSKVEAG